MNGTFYIEEGEVLIDRKSVRQYVSKQHGWPGVSINLDKVVAFWCYDGDEGVGSDCKIIMDTCEITVLGYGATDIVNSQGLGTYICDSLTEAIKAPIGVNYRRDGRYEDDNDIHVVVDNLEDIPQ